MTPTNIRARVQAVATESASSTTTVRNQRSLIVSSRAAQAIWLSLAMTTAGITLTTAIPNSTTTGGTCSRIVPTTTPHTRVALARPRVAR